ncbi:MAG TPA: hypothetical protein VHB77_14320, partial [Planctomycetaceae bacterium]|nr:hypothetical protein [Planctomycetaceae bacterium]
MQTIWKLTALAAVIGAGLVVVVQAQRGLDIPGFPGTQALADEAESDDDLNADEFETASGDANEGDDAPRAHSGRKKPPKRRARET